MGDATDSETYSAAKRQEFPIPRKRVQFVVFSEINGGWHPASPSGCGDLAEGYAELADYREMHPHATYRLVRRTITEKFADD